MKFTSIKSFVALSVTAIMFASCGSVEVDPNHVIVHTSADADKINPMISTSSFATQLESKIFSGLLGTDQETLELIPLLVVARPTITEITEGEYAGGMSLEYEIRPEATWDNGTPVTAHDYVFTMKAIKNPKISAGSIRSYMDFIRDVVIDKDNPKKFTIFSNKKYIVAEAFSGYIVYPEYHYDEKQLMRQFTFAELNDAEQTEKLKANPDIIAVAETMNSNNYSRLPNKIVGCGPYKLKRWTTGQSVILELKKDWWGFKVKNATGFNVTAPVLRYKLIQDRKTAVTAAKDEGVDVVSSVPPDIFLESKKNERFTSLYNFYTPVAPRYDYIGMNTKNPKLEDKRVRRAIAHLVNRKEIISTVMNDLATPIIGPVHPSKPYYNSDLAPIEFDPAKAKALLAEAGWADSDGDGVLDKEIDGELVQMKLSYKYNADNNVRKEVGLILQEDAKRAGIKIEPEPLEWTVFLEHTKRRDFELKMLAWVQGTTLDDFKQIWHTSSDTPDGSNRVGFGNEESDALIDEIRVTLDETKRNELYKKFQEITYDEQPYVFLMSPKERMVIHNRFENAKPSLARPGYFEEFFKLKEGAAATDAQ